MAKSIYFVTCPVCRRRYPSRTLLEKTRDDFSVIDYPVQTAVSLGCRGFRVTDYLNWARLRTTPSEVSEAFFVFLHRVKNTDALLRELQLLYSREYATAYAPGDDLSKAYGLREVRYIGY